MNVPCNGCVMCCRNDVIRMLPGEAEHYLTEPMSVVPGRGMDRRLVPGQLMLAHKSNGDCIYLAENGCSIHDRKPSRCREFDCRNLAKTGYTQARKHGVLHLWQRGKQLSCH